MRVTAETRHKPDSSPSRRAKEWLRGAGLGAGPAIMAADGRAGLLTAKRGTALVRVHAVANAAGGFRPWFGHYGGALAVGGIATGIAAVLIATQTHDRATRLAGAALVMASVAGYMVMSMVAHLAR